MQKLFLDTLEWNSTQEPYLCDSLELSAVCKLTSKHEILGPAYGVMLFSNYGIGVYCDTRRVLCQVQLC